MIQGQTVNQLASFDPKPQRGDRYVARQLIAGLDACVAKIIANPQRGWPIPRTKYEISITVTAYWTVRSTDFCDACHDDIPTLKRGATKRSSHSGLVFRSEKSRPLNLRAF